ncbi:hypothetical protein [Curtobacterium sp. MCBD17_026]|uniref:hypothetical protein n=1 Tax=Curtobacterium sp. MCBD17_026 TaxID=2175621 RepID=UPI000DA9458C|nr:hypothetical protein [Curtobacterium sp. MCBD17_026]WIB69783.1 hypothetical protein DEI85_11480 [Curtobacterium sp. MCBD17_026]
MSDWVYDWLADMTLPALAGIGGIVVGTGAMVAAHAANKVAEQSRAIAEQSLALAEQVRGDEQRREADAGRERYRDQLFRTVEPAVTALLGHRAEVAAGRGLADRSTVAEVLTRLQLILAVVNDEDEALIIACLNAYERAVARQDLSVIKFVLGGLALKLPLLLADDRDLAALVQETDGLVEDAIRETAPEPL